MLLIIVKAYLMTVALTLVTDMVATARSQYYGIPIGKGATLGAIVCAIVPIANLVVAYDNLTMLLEERDEFIVRFMYVKGRMNEIKFVDDEGNEVDNDFKGGI